jgi:hypothetical protein
MADILNCLPERVRGHFVNLRNVRTERDVSAYQTALREHRAKMAARGVGASGVAIVAEWSLAEKLANDTVRGQVEDALDTCRLYDIQLTRQLCDCLLAESQELLVLKFQHTVSGGTHSGFGIRAPMGFQQHLEEMAMTRRFRIMPEIHVIVETARVEDEKRRSEMEKKPSGGSTYTQNITQHGGVLNASQTGDVIARQITVGDYERLQAALGDMRKFFKDQNTLDSDEYAGLLAGAEKAAATKDEGKMRGILKQIPVKVWEIGKPVLTQTLIAYLKSHGMAS